MKYKNKEMYDGLWKADKKEEKGKFIFKDEKEKF